MDGTGEFAECLQTNRGDIPVARSRNFEGLMKLVPGFSRRGKSRVPIVNTSF